MARRVNPTMQALKALVIFMGILIAIGVTVVGVTIYRRATDMVTADKATGDKAASSASQSTAGQTPNQADQATGPAAGNTGLAAQSGMSGALSLKDAAPASFGTRELNLPAGSEIVSVQSVSLQQGVEQIVVHAKLPDGGASILVLDPRRGNIAGEWRMRGASDSSAAPRP